MKGYNIIKVAHWHKVVSTQSIKVKKDGIAKGAFHMVALRIVIVCKKKNPARIKVRLNYSCFLIYFVFFYGQPGMHVNGAPQMMQPPNMGVVPGQMPVPGPGPGPGPVPVGPPGN